MSVFSGPEIANNGLVLNLDAANARSYPGTGTVWNDLSGNGNNGTLINGTSFNNGNGGSMVFNAASSNYITLGNNKYQYQDLFTFEAFCKFTTLPTNTGVECTARHPIAYNHDFGYNMLVNQTGLLEWNIYNSGSSNKVAFSNTSVIGNRYFHCVGTKNGTTISLYLNGVFQSSQSLTTNAVHYIAQPFTIGGYAICGSNRFYATGNISMVKMYNRTLPAAEIQQNFEAMRGRYGI